MVRIREEGFSSFYLGGVDGGGNRSESLWGRIILGTKKRKKAAVNGNAMSESERGQQHLRRLYHYFSLLINKSLLIF